MVNSFFDTIFLKILGDINFVLCSFSAMSKLVTLLHFPKGRHHKHVVMKK